MSNAARTVTAERAEIAEIRNGLLSVFTLTAEHAEHAEIRIGSRVVFTPAAEHLELAETRQGIFSAISAASAVFFGTVTC